MSIFNVGDDVALKTDTDYMRGYVGARVDDETVTVYWLYTGRTETVQESTLVRITLGKNGPAEESNTTTSEESAERRAGADEPTDERVALGGLAKFFTASRITEGSETYLSTDNLEKAISWASRRGTYGEVWAKVRETESRILHYDNKLVCWDRNAVVGA